MKVLIYWEQESWGGVDTHLLELLSNWPCLDDEIVLMVNEGNAGFKRLGREFEMLPHVRCVSVPSYAHNEVNRRFRLRPLLRRFSKFLYFFQPITYAYCVKRMRLYFKKEGAFDVLLSNNGGYPAAWGTICALEAAVKVGIKTRILIVHHAAMKPLPFMGWFESLIDQRMSSLASAVVCVSQATRRTLLECRRFDHEKLSMRVIHNAVSPPPETPLKSVDIRGMIHAQPREKLIGILGRVDRYKGHEDLIFALSGLSPEQAGEFRLVVIGSGADEELDHLKSMVSRLGMESRVHFLGYIEGRSIDLIKQLDILAMVTRTFEGFGLTLAEAILAGVPVLATRVGAVTEFIDETTGNLVNPESPAEIAEKLIGYSLDPEKWEVRARTAKEKVKRSGKQMAEEYRQLISQYLTAAS